MFQSNPITNALRDARGILTEVGRIAVTVTAKQQTVPAALLEQVLNSRLIDPPAEGRVWQCLPPALVARCHRALVRSGRQPTKKAK